MKILNIHFKNINSLEGESRVNFEQAPFSDTGVFAITGPNGSGKSSILDAITLGLYGETFRFNKPASFVMTKHSAECFSEVEFALGNEKYKSSWYVQREEKTADGELMPAQMQLIRLNDGEVIANSAQQVCTRITEITGMNFRNFTRSIMLAQGDFAAFLNALDSERMDILEKIISTDIYTDYKKEVTDKADNAQKILNQLKQNLAAIPLMDSQKQEACEHDLFDFKEQVAEFEEKQNDLKRQQSLLRKISALQDQISEQKKGLKKAKTQLKNIQESLDQIDANQNALLFENDLNTISEKQQAIKQSKITLANYHDELQQLKNKLGNDAGVPENVAPKSFTEQLQTIADIKAQVNHYGSIRQSETVLWQSLGTQINEKKSILATVDTWLEEHATDESLLTNFPETGKLKKLRTELIELSAKQKSFTKRSKHTISSLKNNSSALSQANKKFADLKQQVEADEKELEKLLKGNNSDVIETLRQQQQERVKDFQTLNNLALAHQKLAATSFSFFGFKRKEAPVEPDAEILSLDLDKLKQELKREENIKLALDDAIFRESLLKKMLADRKYLVDGKPCPLCGALQHPYAKHPPVIGNSLQALVDQQLKIKSLTTRIHNLELQITAAHKRTEKNQAIQTRRQQLSSQWLTLCNRLNIATQELDINNLKLMQQLLKTETDELKNIVSLATKYRSKNTNIENLKTAITKNVATVEQLQISVQQLEADNQGRSQEQIDIETALANCQQEEKQLAEQISQQLTLLGEKMPAKGKEDELFDRLTVRRQDYHGYAFRRKNLTAELETLTVKQLSSQTEITRCNEQLERLTGQLHSEESIGLHLALIEKQKLIIDKEQLLMQQDAEIHSLQQVLLEKLQATQFTSLNELSNALELLQNQPELEQQKTALEQEIDNNTQELEKNGVMLETDLKLAEFSLNSEDIAIELKDTSEKMAIAKLEAQRMEKLLKEQKLLQQDYDAVLSQLHLQEQQFQPDLAEAALIAAESGMDFRRRVQARIAGRLLSQTNTVLEKISGRYYLRQKPSEQGLALEIEDTFQNNVRRLPKTLSGGESFVVSLALALGLSELANSGKSVDSLFLDEGFGNLDADSLYTVISTLEGLQTHGKIVGVISHVEAVQKRFKAQLQVVKKPNGLGMLKQAS